MSTEAFEDFYFRVCAGVDYEKMRLAMRPLELLRVQGFEMVRASGNAPEPGTDLVRCGV